MASNDATPGLSHLPGGWIETPADPSRHQSYIGSQQQTHDDPATSYSRNGTNAHHTTGQSYYSAGGAGLSSASSNSTAVASTDAQTCQNATNEHERQDRITQNGVATERTHSNGYIHETSGGPVEQRVELENDTSDSELEGDPTATKQTGKATRPSFNSKSSRPRTEEDLFRALSRRRTSQSNGLSKTNTGATGHSAEEEDEINNLMSKMFGRTRREASEEEKTRHQGVIFKHLTVKGMGLGAALQPSVGALFLDPIRFIKNLLTKGPRQAAGKPPVRTILDDFSGCIRPGEMVLVLGYVNQHDPSSLLLIFTGDQVLDVRLSSK